MKKIYRFDQTELLDTQEVLERKIVVLKMKENFGLERIEETLAQKAQTVGEKY